MNAVGEVLLIYPLGTRVDLSHRALKFVPSLPVSPREPAKRLRAETSERDIRIEAEPDDPEEGEDTSTPLSTPLRGRIAQLIADS